MKKKIALLIIIFLALAVGWIIYASKVKVSGKENPPATRSDEPGTWPHVE